MRRLAIALAMALSVVSTSAGCLPLPPATPEKLETIATALEAMKGPSRVVDQRIADMLRPFAATEGVTIPLIAPAYTQFPASAEKLRPKGWLIEIGELNNGWVTATLQKWALDANLNMDALAAVHEKGGRNDCQCGDAAGGMALSAAMLRAWAQDMREQGQ